jgi:hypothetical protein
MPTGALAIGFTSMRARAVEWTLFLIILAIIGVVFTGVLVTDIRRPATEIRIVIPQK